MINWNSVLLFIGCNFFSKIVHFSKYTYGCHVLNAKDPTTCFFSDEIKQDPWCNCQEILLKIGSIFLLNFSTNRNPAWLGSVSYKSTIQRFVLGTEYLWPFFIADMFEKQMSFFGLFLILNAFYNFLKNLITLFKSLITLWYNVKW